MTDNGATPTGNTGAATGSGAPNDAPPTEGSETFTREDLDTVAAKTRRAATEDGVKRGRAELLKQLGVQDEQELTALLESGRKAAPQKKSDAEQVAEKVRSEFEAKLEAERAARLEAEQRANMQQIRSFLLQHVGETNDPGLALAMFGLPYEPEYTFDIKDGRIVTIDRDGTPMPHKDPAKVVREMLSRDERAFLRKPTGGGGGSRVNGSNGNAESNAPPAKYERNPSKRNEAIKSLVRRAAAAGGGDGGPAR